MLVKMLKYVHNKVRLGKNLNLFKKQNLSAVKSSENQNFVDGRRCLPQLHTSSKVINNINPGTGAIIGQFYCSGKDELERAVANSKEAFEVWSHQTVSERSSIFRRAAKAIRSKKLDIARLETIDTGKTITESSMDVDAVIESCNYYASLCYMLHGQQIPVHNGALVYTVREPLGVCLGIGAWNFPFLNIAWKALPALACGNTLVYKPSPNTPITSVVFAEIMADVGLPAGCLNIVQGDGEAGQYLCEHKDIAKVSFTGSISTGTKIMAACAPTLKKLTLELGGKSPLVIFEDADIDNAVQGALMANFIIQGEACSNGTRVYVHESILDSFLEKVVEATRNLNIGDTMDARTHIGALISLEHLEKVQGFINRAVSEGAKILCGGDKPKFENRSFANGYYINPCIMTHCHDGMEIIKEEHFGPIMCVMPFSNEEEVLNRANSSTTGLAAGVFTKNISRAHKFIAKLQAGSCYINTYNMYPVQVPFGGNKMSGIGRENGTQVIEHYTQTKSVYVELNEVDSIFK
ncbi:4-trimethylaminobutyraldehyde dehydrogenase [Hydra vulgaris]|uniref:4-trimethylaminobutyraldehyde dehydrogenase n=1 Tax=Hydra vulgaris TaxID=6087 RepID=UPI001F5F0971|nr:4-trimethylaminobutyraldehyde dehydrogenase [Hydra vulgaris]